MLTLDGTHLSLVDILAVARDRRPVRLAATVLGLVRRSEEYAAEVASLRHVYGRSTGVGANRDLLPTDPEAQALALLRSHATSAGPLRSPERVRGMLVIRLNQLASDGNGISPAILEALAGLVNGLTRGEAVPPVREYGGVGTADLAALATTALVLCGELPGLGAEAVRFGAGDALVFLSSNAGVLADAALAVADLDRLARALPVVAALGFAAVRGNAEAYAPAVEAATPFPGARWVCASMRALVDSAVTPARIQDPFGLRTLPQVHGAFVDRLSETERVVLRMANAPSENPALSPAYRAGEGDDSGIAHHGAFHAAYLGQALDALVSAAAQSAQLSLARTTMLAEPAYTGLEPFLGDGTPAASGTMMIEYTAASALAELRSLAMPAGLQTVVLSRGVEDDASFADLSARQALRAVGRLRTVLAGELVAALRALRQHGLRPARLAPYLARIDDSALGTATADRDLTEDLLVAESLLDHLTISQEHQR